MSQADRQDWEPVILRREKTKEEKIKSGDFTTVRKQQPANGHASSVSRQMANDFDPENMQRIVTSNHELGKAIQVARGNTKSRTDPEKSMTQSELDQACAFPKNTVRDYENGSAKVVPEQLNTLNRVLGVVLPRPPKAKAVKTPNK